MRKLNTFLRVFQTFGLLEVIKLINKKILNSRAKNLNKNSVLTNLSSVDEVLTRLNTEVLNLDLGNVCALKNEFKVIYQSSTDIKRDGFFNQEYDIGEQLAMLAFLLIRLINPKLVIETGVAAGRSSRLILKAIQLNNFGSLESFDITDKVGELIPVELKDRWKLRVLKGMNLGSKFKTEIDKFESDFIFLHDSDHDINWQKLEILTCILTGKCRFFLIDDVSPDLIDFLIEQFGLRHFFIFQEKQKFSAFAYL